MLSHLFSSIARLIDIIFPDACVGCSREGTLLCNQCIRALPPPRQSPHDFIHPLFDYRDRVIKDVVWCLKYKHQPRLAHHFGEILYQKFLEIAEDELGHTIQTRFIVIPIPLYPSRERARGYNQSALLGKALCVSAPPEKLIMSTDVLKRTRNTPPQARREKRNERLKNLEGAFTINNTQTIRGAYIILIDDVSTTGATLLEARRALVPAKPRKVIALTLAH